MWAAAGKRAIFCREQFNGYRADLGLTPLSISARKLVWWPGHISRFYAAARHEGFARSFGARWRKATSRSLAASLDPQRRRDNVGSVVVSTWDTQSSTPDSGLQFVEVLMTYHTDML